MKHPVGMSYIIFQIFFLSWKEGRRKEKSKTSSGRYIIMKLQYQAKDPEINYLF